MFLPFKGKEISPRADSFIESQGLILNIYLSIYLSPFHVIALRSHNQIPASHWSTPSILLFTFFTCWEQFWLHSSLLLIMVPKIFILSNISILLLFSFSLVENWCFSVKLMIIAFVFSHSVQFPEFQSMCWCYQGYLGFSDFCRPQSGHGWHIENNWNSNLFSVVNT